MKTTQQTEIKTNWEETIESFDQLDLKPDLLRGIYGNFPLLKSLLLYFKVMVSLNLPLSNPREFFLFLRPKIP